MYSILCLCLHLLTALTIASSKRDEHSKSVVSVNPAKSVGLNLETTLLFEPKEAKRDLVLIDSLRTFLDKIKSVVREKGKKKHKKYFRTVNKAGNSEVLTDFLTNIGNALQEYSDEELKNVSKIFKNEVNKLLDTYVLDTYHESHNDKYKRLFSDPNIKHFIKHIVHEWTALDTEYLKRKIRNLINTPKEDKLVRNLNSLYGERDKEIFDKIVAISKAFPKKHYDLSSVIRKSLNYTIFDKFDHASFDLKDKMLDYINELSLHVNDNLVSKNQLDHSKNRRKLIDEIFPSLKKSEEDFYDLKNNKSTENINSIEEITHDSEQKDNVIENEIVINKNIQIDVNNDGIIQNVTIKNYIDDANKTK